jgi:spore photoproduct lyase
LGQGTITSRSKAGAAKGTTYEASCYTEPLGIEHLTGSLSAIITYFGNWQADAQLRLTTKFDAVEPLLHLPHGGKTRVRISLNPPLFARFEGGTAPVAARLAAMRRLAFAGYKIGLTIAPIILAEGWDSAYGGAHRRGYESFGMRAGRRFDGGTHQPPVHSQLEGRARELVSWLRP